MPRRRRRENRIEEKRFEEERRGEERRGDCGGGELWSETSTGCARLHDVIDHAVGGARAVLLLLVVQEEDKRVKRVARLCRMWHSGVRYSMVSMMRGWSGSPACHGVASRSLTSPFNVGVVARYAGDA